MNKVQEIVGAWITSFNPTEEQKELAENRYSICFDCDKRKKKLGVEYCSECGCPLSKKIFTQKPNDTCPLGKWESAEQRFRERKIKENKYKLL